MSETPKTDSESQKSENPKNPNFGQDLQGTLTWATRDLGTRPHCTQPVGESTQVNVLSRERDAAEPRHRKVRPP